MPEYVALENGRLENGAARYELFKGDQIIMIHDPEAVGKHLREIMKPGDTYQELYESGRASEVFSYDDMLLIWRRIDAFDAGDMATYYQLSEAEPKDKERCT